MKREHVIDILLSLIVMLFLYASISKLWEFKGFIAAINRQPLPEWSKPILVWAVPMAEILVSLCLLYDNLIHTLAIYLHPLKRVDSYHIKLKVRLVGLYGALILMTTFSIYTGLAVFGAFKHRPCGCGGVINNLTWGGHFALNLFYTAITVAAIWLTRKEQSGTGSEVQFQPSL